jgi:hypothetical protein
VALGPAQIHAKEHLRPVRGLGAAGSGADREERVATVVRATEEQVSPGDGVLSVQLRRLAGDIVEEALVAFLLGELEQLDGRLGSRLEMAPERELLPEAFGLTERFLSGSLIVPETRLANLRVEIR